MFDPATIKEEFIGLAGLRQNDNPAFETLSPSLIYNGDNVLINHALMSIENIDMTARNYGKYQFTGYQALTDYVVGDRVTYLNVNYECIQDGTGQTPSTSPLYWKVLKLLDLFLQDLFASAAEDVVNEVMNRKKIAAQTKTLLSSLRFMNGVGNMTDLIVKEGNLVGVQVKLLYNNNILAILERIGLQLSQAQDDVTIYIYHSSQLEPVETLTLNHTKTSSFQWHEVKKKLNYLTDDQDAGGVFFIMYDEDELDGQAIRKNHNFNAAPCGYCNMDDVRAYNLYSKYIYMSSCKVKAADRNGINLWDLTKTIYTPDTNWGMNFEMTMRCDITKTLVQQKDVFAYAYRDMVTKKLLEIMANTTRQNGAQTKLDVLARNELQASYAGGMGFMKQLEDQLKAVNFEFSELDSTCMPCNKTNGLGYGTAGLSHGR